MKNVRVKVRHFSCPLQVYDFGIYEGRKILMDNCGTPLSWMTEKAAIRNAKAMAKGIGIPYDPEIVKQHGC